MQVLTSKEVTKKLNISRATLYVWVRNEGFPKPFHIGGGRKTYWDEADVNKWLTSKKEMEHGSGREAETCTV